MFDASNPTKVEWADADRRRLMATIERNGGEAVVMFEFGRSQLEGAMIVCADAGDFGAVASFDASKTYPSWRPLDPRDGQQFFDSVLGKPIWFSMTKNGWVDVTGALV